MVLRLLELLLTLPLLATCAAEEPISEPASKQVFFGDLHLHTRYSNDAFYLTTEEGLDEAYNYAKGEAVTRTNGDSVKLNTPLDFLAVTEHAEFLGAAQSFVDPSHPLYDHPTLGRLLRSPESDERMKAWFAFEKGAKAGGAFDGYDEEALKQAVWTAIVDAADRHNNPGTFTTFAAYEWTAYIEGGNMHRNVIFNDTKDLSVPFTARESNRPEDLWTFLERMRSTGIEALAIPHNPNVSDGRMFTALDSDGGPIDAAYAARRTRNEPLVEITQNKGTSETHPELSPDDAFADHEIWPLLITGHNKVGKVEGSYVRDALLLGINEKRLRGFNPLMFGFVGATDSHSGLSNIEEDNSPGFGGSLYDSTP
ncbi:MAG: DUF3604 domain-containing protein, partial [Proteobacteria bacterium]|nr:DUF3604 domain-containing protein [Pseudomonadota bacterium]